MTDNQNDPKPIFAEELPNAAFGDYNADGSVNTDAQVSALSGRPVSAGDPHIRIPGTNAFYRLTSDEWVMLKDTDDTERQAVNDETRQRIVWASSQREAAQGADDASFRRTYDFAPIETDTDEEG